MAFNPIDARFESIGNGDSFRRGEKHNGTLAEILRKQSQLSVQLHARVASVAYIERMRA